MHPTCLTADGFPRTGGNVKHQNTILTAHNGTRIEKFGVVTIPCQYNHGRQKVILSRHRRARYSWFSQLETTRTRSRPRLAYSRKQNGKLRICLNPKDLNKAINICYHHTLPLSRTHTSSRDPSTSPSLMRKMGIGP